MNRTNFLLRLLSACCVLFLGSSEVSGQWSMLGSFTDVHMLENGRGLALQAGWNGSPTGGGTWRIYHTLDDWQNLEARAGDPTGDLGCCYTGGFAVHDANTVFLSIRNMGTYFPLRSTNGGNSFSPFGGNFFDNITAAQAYSQDEYYLIGTPYSQSDRLLLFKQISNQRILILDDSTYIGTKARLQKVTDSLLFVSATDTNGIVRLLRSTDDGSTWSNPLSIGLGDYLAVDFVNSQVGYVGGSNGTFYKSVDGGLTWNSLFLNGPVNVGAIDFINPDTGFVATQEGLLLSTFNGGQSWNSELVDSTANFVKLQALSLDAIYAYASSRKLYKRGGIFTSSEALSASMERLKLVPNGQPNGYLIQLPDAWTLQSWQLFDLAGGKLEEGDAQALSLEGRPAGIYLLRIFTNKGLESIKLRKM